MSSFLQKKCQRCWSSWATTQTSGASPCAPVAGSAGGNLALDQHVAATVGDSTGRAILTVARAVGVDLPDFGENDHYTDMSINELEA